MAKILLVEDLSASRELYATMLSNLNYEVVEAASGEEGLEIAKKEGSSFNVLVTDLVLPGIGGLELASEVYNLCPDIKILIISGYTEDMVILEDHLKTNTVFLAKPFEVESLNLKIQELLA
ncbi:response regulator [Opitutia bacterium ISCC 51]|nr:response regulator [Opitutae bacterium ISCC 51]QXD28386.1 response regulator [Opitutae bacterium ISCC 52]